MPDHFDYCFFVVNFEFSMCKSFTFFSRLIWLFGALAIPYIFENQPVHAVEILICILLNP